MGIGDELTNEGTVTPQAAPVAQPQPPSAPVSTQPSTEQVVPVHTVGEPNVRLSSKAEALNKGPHIIGRVRIDVPDEAGQRAGFYTEHAGTLVAQERGRFKFVEAKGEPSTNSVTI